MSARTDLAELLAEQFPEWDVQPFYAVPDNVERPRLVVYGGTYRRGVARGLLALDAVVWLLVPDVEPAEVDDKLDELLVELLDQLDAAGVVNWTEAERGNLADAFAGYRVTVTMQYDKRK